VNEPFTAGKRDFFGHARNKAWSWLLKSLVSESCQVPG
jgi:hypothetical protein